CCAYHVGLSVGHRAIVLFYTFLQFCSLGLLLLLQEETEPCQSTQNLHSHTHCSHPTLAPTETQTHTLLTSHSGSNRNTETHTAHIPLWLQQKHRNTHCSPHTLAPTQTRSQ